MVVLVGGNLVSFVRRLESCEANVQHFSDWENKFVADMRERFNSREDAQDLGIQEWNPTVKQMNQLQMLAKQIGYFG